MKGLTAQQAKTSVPEILSNGLVQRLKEQLLDLQNQRTELLKRYLAKHPDVLAIDKKIKRLKKSLTQEVDGILTSLERTYQANRSSERRLGSEVAKARR